MTLALILFAIAAVGGISLAFIRLSGKPLPPMWLALVHGAVAAAGLVALILAVMAPGAASGARIALGLFVIAALGGFVLFSFHLRSRALPVPLVAIHGIVAVVAFVFLLIAFLGHS
jgi:glucose uptake protein GlcU